MEKYIGNKKRMVDDIEGLVNSLGVKQGSFLDIFAGTNNVAKRFKKNNFYAITNDLNECSYVFSKAIIESDHVPQFGKIIRKYRIEEKVTGLIDDYLKLNSNGHKYIWNEFKADEKNSIYALTFLSFIDRFAKEILQEEKFDPYYLISRNYCPGGSRSVYSDRSEEKKRRMFFTDSHGKQIDYILNLLKYWRDTDLLSESEFYFLLSSLIHAATLFSNTSGVYEAFYKEWFPNTQQQFRLPIPDLEAIKYGSKGKSYNADSNKLVKKMVNRVDVLYVDPPYNSRQYSSNYHILNLLAKFHKIDDLHEYEAKLTGARGQNPEDNFKSKFSSRGTFKQAMEDLLYEAKAKHVVVSYFDGGDNLWKDDNNQTGIKMISSIFRNKKFFKENSLKVKKVPRQNFQSGNGLKKKIVNELLFSGEKKLT